MQSEKVSSQAITKYGLDASTPYVELEKHTNLNQPPSNWLKDNLAGKFAGQSTKKRKPFDCSSLLIASKYPEVIGEIDVVSSADHIKKLLKVPYSNADLSMTVHRIGKSLLLNDLDVPALLQTKFYEENPNLHWLRDLYCTASNAPQDSEFYPKKRNKEQSELSVIQSKFMYYSIKDGNSDISQNQKSSNVDVAADEKPLIQSDGLETNDISDSASSLIPTSNLIDQESWQSDSYFLRDVLWTFEDITMLVGSNLPIFGGGKYPAVSLRLRDSSKPISVLTGIDYWLDNLMCNVPELMMCFHLKGIVQKYEQIKTADLPNLEGSSFSPKVIKDVAQNILSFLKSNCTKEGHTYWLFRSSKDDVVKLYDLTSICADNSVNDRRNPFSLVVAVLLYRIVLNMFGAGEINKKTILKARTLLEHCTVLLEKENRPELSFLANYLLAELFTTVCNDSASPSESDDELDSRCPSDDESSESEKSFDSPVTTVSVKNLVIPGKQYPSLLRTESPFVYVDEENKCKKILSSITDSLRSLFYLEKASQSDTKGTETLDDWKNQGQDRSEMQVSSVISSFFDKVLLHDLTLMRKAVQSDPIQEDNISFSSLKNTLLEKAVKCYITLININITRKRLGRALRFILISTHCINTQQPLPRKSHTQSHILMLYGDILTLIVNSKNNSESELEEFKTFNELDVKLCNLLDTHKIPPLSHLEKMEESFVKSREQLFMSALEVYEYCLSKTGDDEQNDMDHVIELTRRLGNIRNELGNLYMNQAASMAKQFGSPSEQEINLWKKSFGYFENSVQAFEVVKDRANQALLYANMGRLMQLCAQVYGYSTRSNLEESRGQFTQQEKTYFHKSFEYYQKGLSLVQGNNPDQSAQTSICMKLSDAYFMMAITLQDYAPLKSMAEEKVVKEVSSSLMKVLQYGEPLLNVCTGVQKHTITIRLAMVHQRLGSLYHHVLLNQISDNGKKNYRSLAELHYKKVYGILDANIHSTEVLRVFVLHSALHDYILKQNHSGKNLKSKLDLFLQKSLESSNSLIQALDKIEKTSKTNEYISNATTSEGEVSDISRRSSATTETSTDLNELDKILTLLEAQLKTTTKDVIKFLANKKNKVNEFIDLSCAKRMYEIILRGFGSSEMDLLMKISSMVTIIQNLRDVYNS